MFQSGDIVPILSFLLNLLKLSCLTFVKRIQFPKFPSAKRLGWQTNQAVLLIQNLFTNEQSIYPIRNVESRFITHLFFNERKTIEHTCHQNSAHFSTLSLKIKGVYCGNEKHLTMNTNVCSKEIPKLIEKSHFLIFLFYEQ